MKKRTLDKSTFLLFFIILLIIGMIITGYFFMRPDILTNTFKKGLPLKILFLVSDGDDLKFIELFLYHPEQKKGGFFFIPPHLGTKIESLDRMDRISVLYKKGNITPLRKKIEQIINMDIPFYIDMQVGNIIKMADLVDGIEIFISNPVDVEYEGKKILLPSGNVILDGDKLEDYILYEEPNEEEREKVWRKQKFLQALLKRIGEPGVNEFLQEDIPFKFFCNLLYSNISRRDLRSFIQEMSEFNTEHMYPGRVEGKVYLVEDKELLFPHFKGEYLKMNVKQLLDTISSEDAFDDEVLTVTLEILNGTEVNGLASRTARLFQSYGYDVISVSNADQGNYTSTIILDRKGRIDIAKKVAEIIKCERVRTEIKSSEGESADITIILGKDFDGKSCKQ
ncbi:MAG: LCP family protein [Spirochaetales bacterium]|nr:LCP family protein [Spirochaetales bacterium]